MMLQAMLVVGPTSLTGVITVLFFVKDMAHSLSLTNLESDILMIIFALVCIVSSALSYIIIERFGRITIIRVGTFGMALSNVVFAVGMIFKINLLSFVMVNLYFAFYLASMGTVKWIYIGEIGSISIAFACYLSYWAANLIACVIWPLLIHYMYVEWFIFAGMSVVV